MLIAHRKYKTFECDVLHFITIGSDLYDRYSYLQPGVSRLCLLNGGPQFPAIYGDGRARPAGYGRQTKIKIKSDFVASGFDRPGAECTLSQFEMQEFRP
ncbi:hypothetical protein EVAR_35818_1 [Eumeta japonica]|uniref:Uncharacterized protein n=1 Tax=Eumeta variegata TaxID=151549 RepID=A0A4C1WZS2_EUMVA|nr:hypothetical protein EVAR_35818_1 [Eumeta japonica]